MKKLVTGAPEKSAFPHQERKNIAQPQFGTYIQKEIKLKFRESIWFVIQDYQEE